MDPCERWYAPHGKKAQEKVEGVEPCWRLGMFERLQEASERYGAPLSEASEEYVSVGNAIDTYFYIVHLPTKRVWEMRGH
jgi:hypothetical protein